MAAPGGAEATPTGAEAAPDPVVRHEVLETVRTLFRGMALKDFDLLRSALLPDAIVRPVADLEGPQESMSGEAFVEQVMASPEELLERMFDPVVRVDGPLAHVWTPYDFWRNGEFSHCGTDSFDLIRTPDGWRISSVTYTLHPEELCPERPPPRGAS